MVVVACKFSGIVRLTLLPPTVTLKTLDINDGKEVQDVLYIHPHLMHLPLMQGSILHKQ